MANVLNIPRAYIDAYDEDPQSIQRKIQIGAGVQTDPSIYARDSYRKSKINSLAIGLVSSIVYSAYEHDPTPNILVLDHVPQYACVLGLNLRYLPPSKRKDIISFVLESNRQRIKTKQPMVVDYQTIKSAIPETQYIVRLYKQILIGLRKTYTLSELPQVITESSPFQTHFAELKNARK